MAQTKELLTTGDVARRLGCEAWHVRRIFEHGDLPEPARFAGKRAFRPGDLPKIKRALRKRGFLKE